MGRPSKLSDAQWAEIGRRLTAGEKVSALAREYGVSKAAVSGRFSERTETVKALARKVADVELEFESRPLTERSEIRFLADKFKRITTGIADTGASNAQISRRLSALAELSMDRVADQNGMINREELANVVALVTTSNKAAEIPMQILAMTKTGGALAEDPEDSPGSGKREIILINDPDAP